METPRALITGIDGFTGSYVKQNLLGLGYRVYGFSNGFSDEKNGVYMVDLLAKSDVELAVAKIKPNVVIHLAAIAFVADGDIANMYASNIMGSRNLLEALASLDYIVDSIVLASTANLYNAADGQIITEKTPVSPSNDYGVSKLAMELIANIWRDRLPITIVRPFNYTGVDQSLRFVIPKIVDHFSRNEKSIELGNLNVYRDFSDVRMVAEVYSKIIDKGISGEVLNICSGNTYTLADILSRMASICGYEIRVVVNPEFVRSNEIERLSGSQDKLIEVLGPITNYSLDETLNWMYQDKNVH